MSEFALEDSRAIVDAARDAADGQVVYLTEHGKRIAGVVPAELAAALERMSADELDEMAAAAAEAGFAEGSRFLEDLADRAAVLESRADPGPGIPHEQVRATAGRKLGRGISHHLEQARLSLEGFPHPADGYGGGEAISGFNLASVLPGSVSGVAVGLYRYFGAE